MTFETHRVPHALDKTLVLPLLPSPSVSGPISDSGADFPSTTNAAGRFPATTLLTLFLKLLLRIPQLEY